MYNPLVYNPHSRPKKISHQPHGVIRQALQYRKVPKISTPPPKVSTPENKHANSRLITFAPMEADINFYFWELRFQIAAIPLN